MAQCNCEHVSHNYRACVNNADRSYRSYYVGTVCDECAADCVPEYIYHVKGLTMWERNNHPYSYVAVLDEDNELIASFFDDDKFTNARKFLHAMA